VKNVLDGIRVVEMTEALAGPYCAMLLGDLGADVIKVRLVDGARPSSARPRLIFCLPIATSALSGSITTYRKDLKPSIN
jgi:crotonobetainyl-CoA:carnitine CoA-transferase CaiB-like acyl-CoA transferase